MFDKQFDLVPFQFPEFTPTLSWFDDVLRLDRLMEIFEEERSRGPLLYERLVEASGQHLIFRIAPSQRADRDFFNEFVLQKFLSHKTSIQRAYELKLVGAASPLRQVRDSLDAITEALERIPRELRKNPASLATKFLQIFYNGVLAPGFEWNSSVVVRRKFIELYLYSQGLLLSDHYRWLRNKLGDLNTESHLETITLPQKIALLHQTGVLDYLRSKLEQQNAEDNLRAVSRIISLLTAGNTIHYSSVLEYLNALGTQDANDSLTKENLRFVQKQLRHL